MNDCWLEKYIEEPVRGTVKLLRDNGFNTESSCGHKMWVQCGYVTDAEIMRLDDLLFNNGYRDYTIDVWVNRKDGWLHSGLNVTFECIPAVEGQSSEY